MSSTTTTAAEADTAADSDYASIGASDQSDHDHYSVDSTPLDSGEGAYLEKTLQDEEDAATPEITVKRLSFERELERNESIKQFFLSAKSNADAAAAESSIEISIDGAGEQQKKKEKVDKAEEHEAESSPSPYRNPLSPEEAVKRIPPGDDKGLVWHATIIPDQFFDSNGELVRGLNPRDYDAEKKEIKLFRGTLNVTASDFFSSLTRIDNTGQIEEHDEGYNFGQQPVRWIFHGILNGWTGLTCLELLSIERAPLAGWAGSTNLPMRAKRYAAGSIWVSNWNADQEGQRGIEPKTYVESTNIYRAKLRSANWSSRGWSESSPGFAFWYEAWRSPLEETHQPKVTYGTNMISTVSNNVKCTAVHMISHRYAVKKESTKDKLTYHSVALLEWDHGQYCTIVEGAYLNGMGGYKGKSNWYHDTTNSPVTGLYRSLPSEMIIPWIDNKAEIRCFDVPHIQGLNDLKEYINQYEGEDNKAARFVDPHYTFSHVARLTYRSKSNIAQYMVNYISRDCSYDELKRNCQTFVADLCGFIAGKKGIEPFHPVNKIRYANRSYLFLYDSNMYA